MYLFYVNYVFMIEIYINYKIILIFIFFFFLHKNMNFYIIKRQDKILYDVNGLISFFFFL
jgi:hypothetical protein